MHKQVLVFDIETKALPEAEVFLPDVSAPANYKDAEKIQAYKEEKRMETLKKAALDPDLGEIVAIGYSIIDIDDAGHYGFKQDDIQVLTRSKFDDEFDMIRSFWNVVHETVVENHGIVCGYNVLDFDIPFIARRTLALCSPGQQLPIMVVLETSRYQKSPVLDLYNVLYNFSQGKGLKWIAKRYGIKPLVEGVSGADVEHLTEEEIVQYCRSDVWLTMVLFDGMNGIYF